MGIEKQSSKSGGGYVGGFLQLFDWNGKSRKKLFAKSDLPEGSKQGKRNVGNLPTTRIHLLEDDENGGSSIRGSSDYSCASSVTDDDANGTKAPGVVARLMGLDSLPTTSVVEPYSTPFFDTQSLRDSHSSYRRSEFRSEYQIMDPGNEPSTLDSFCRNLGDSRFPKMQNRPIERFQTEMLPSKLAKTVPIAHNKLLSPLKNPGFISSKNAAHIMEAASKIVDPRPQPNSTKGKMPSLGSPSTPLKVRDLKEKMEAAQRPSRLNGASRRPVESNAAKILKGQSMNKSWNGSEEPHRFRASLESEESSSVGSRNKGKSVSLAVQAKVNVQKREGFGSGGSRNLKNQKECQEMKSNQSQKNRSNNQKIMPKKSSTENASGVLRQNNQKQNSLMNRDKLVTKPSSNMQGRKTMLGDASFSRNKTSSKAAANSKVVGSKKIGREILENEKDAPSLETKSFPRKKRSIDGTCNFDRGTVVHNVLVDKTERPIQRSVADSRRKGMDVVSFTFTSPMIRSTPGSQSSSPLVDKAKSFSIDSGDEISNAGSQNTKLSPLGLNVIGGDALSILLERKLRELTYGVESSCNNSVKSGAVESASILEDLVSALNAVGTSPKGNNKRSHLGLHSDKFDDPYSPSCSSAYGEVPKMNHKWQGADEMDTTSSISSETRKELDCQYPGPVSILDPSFSNDSSFSFDTGDSDSIHGSKQCSFVEAQQVVDSLCPKRTPLTESDIEIADSASSTFILTAGNENVAKLSIEDLQRSNKQEELGYIREIICNVELVFRDFMLGRTHEIINPHLYEQLEIQFTWSRNDSEEKNSSRQRRKVLFDCVKECLDLRCKRFVGGGCRRWEKGWAMFRNKGWLVEDIYKEISGWGSMGDWMMDELVDKDMSSQYGKWLDFETEEYEEGVEIEDSLVRYLIDEVVADIVSVSIRV